MEVYILLSWMKDIRTVFNERNRTMEYSAYITAYYIASSGLGCK